jgi:hypothetical protein
VSGSGFWVESLGFIVQGSRLMTLRVSNKDLWIMARRFLTLSIRSLHGWQY